MFSELIQLTDFNIVCTVLGGFIAAFGLVSYFVKEQLFLSEARRPPHYPLLQDPLIFSLLSAL